MVTPAIAPVRPRILSPATGDALPLEDFVAETAAKSSCGLIRIHGPAGAGKTTALKHLAATLTNELSVLLLDDDSDPGEVAKQSKQRLVICTAGSSISGETRWRLAPWNEDDLIEYLLARHPEQATNIFQRIRESTDRQWAAGSPELWRFVIDLMASHQDLRSVADALLMAVDVSCHKLNCDRKAAVLEAKRWLRNQPETDASADDESTADELNAEAIPAGSDLWRLMRFPAVRTLIGAEALAQSLDGQRQSLWLTKMLPRDLIQETARRVASMPSALEFLSQYCSSTAASILFAIDRSWRPPVANVNLPGGLFPGARWNDLNLSRASLRAADLSSADLRRVSWFKVHLQDANLEDADLSGAVLRRCSFAKANLSACDLRGVKGSDISFFQCDLRLADARGCELQEARFECANLEQADFSGANLDGAHFTGAEFEGTDFRRADLTATNFGHMRLRSAMIEGAIFSKACLNDCDLEGISWPDAKFVGANLFRAYLTGSVLPRADFRAADLRATGLGEIDWEGADLRGANLKDCSFHLGSTRCGLVDSPYPSEGTRTGFYTNDYDDRYFKAPEEIRKASLRGANLLDAVIDGVDFYLVDLRDAIYDKQQAEHFRRTGAILHDVKID